MTVSVRTTHRNENPMHSTTLRRPPLGRFPLGRLPLAAGSAALLLALSACGSSDDTAETDAQVPATAAGQGAGFPGASGTIAAVSGSTMQVQSQRNGQVAVTWNAKTTFTKQVTAALSDVQVGSCVVATAGGDAGAAADSSTVAATAVRISETAADGTCTGGLGGRRMGGTRPSDAPTDMPSDRPSGGPGGGFGGGFGGGAFGTVTAVSGNGFTVESTAPGSSSTTSVEVTVSSDTTYSATGKATAAAVKTGSCATATGDSDDTGAVTASQVSLSDPVDGQCGMGMGMGVGRGFGGGRGQGS